MDNVNCTKFLKLYAKRIMREIDVGGLAAYIKTAFNKKMNRVLYEYDFTTRDQGLRIFK